MENKQDVADNKTDNKTAVQKVVEFCEKEGIEWRAVVTPEEKTSGGGLIVKPHVIIEYKKNEPL